MIRTSKFAWSPRPYAAKLDGMLTEERPHPGHSSTYYVQVQAVWLGRRSGIVTAALGTLWAHQDRRPEGVQEALERHTDGRYGGHCLARLSAPGGYWAEGGASPEVIERHLEILQPLLDDPGAVPDGYTGWWHF